MPPGIVFLVKEATDEPKNIPTIQSILALYIPRVGGASGMESGEEMQVGFRDVAAFSGGVLVPIFLVCTAMIIAVSVYVGAGAGPGITVGMMVGLVLAMVIEMLRRYVLTTREHGGRGATTILRGTIWLVLVGTPIVLLLVGLGTINPCYGQACDTLSRLVMHYMLACSVVALLLVPLGFGLLKRAVWLQPRGGL